MKGFSIGSVKISNPLVLAPLDGVNCTAFRMLCKECGAGLIYTAMVDTEKFVLDLGKMSEEEVVRRHVNPVDNERPLAIQIVGSKKDAIKDSVRVLSRYADLIDYNLGCCEGDILGRKAGCYLMKHNEQLDNVIPVVIDNSKVPVTCKIRSGWDDVNAVEVARQLEALGVSGVAVHPRSKKQGYRGKADWDVIRQVKEAVGIPVIGNGDIVRPYHAVTMMGQTKCDAVMIGRAAMGDPSIFSRTYALLESGREIEVGDSERARNFLRFMELYKKYESRYRLSEIKDHAMWFTKGMDGARALKGKIKKSNDADKIARVFSKII